MQRKGNQISILFVCVKPKTVKYIISYTFVPVKEVDVNLLGLRVASVKLLMKNVSINEISI